MGGGHASCAFRILDHVRAGQSRAHNWSEPGRAHIEVARARCVDEELGLQVSCSLATFVALLRGGFAVCDKK